jgi:hypothetical protein
MPGAEVSQSSDILNQIQGLVASSQRFSDLDDARLFRGSVRGNAQFVPMIITTDFQVSRGDSGKHILFWSGPSNTTWSFQQRGTIQQTRTGHIAHYWRDDKRSTFFDDPTVAFTFQTGNIMPVRTVGNSLVTFPPGLLDYYDFFTFMDEKKILPDGRPNFINIVYHSLLYPTILLRGFFEPETVISVVEEAGRPAGVTWNATFRIRSSDPPFYDGKKLRDSWYQSIPASLSQGTFF